MRPGVNADESPVALQELRRTSAVVGIVAGKTLRTTRSRDHEVVALGDSNRDCADGGGCLAPRLRPEPVAFDVQGMDLVRAGHERANHNGVADERLQNRRLRVATV